MPEAHAPHGGRPLISVVAFLAVLCALTPGAACVQLSAPPLPLLTKSVSTVVLPKGSHPGELDPNDFSLAPLKPEERGPVDDLRPVTLGSGMTKREKRRARYNGWIDDKIPGVGVVYNANDPSVAMPTPTFDRRDRNPYSFKHRYRRQRELWREYDKVSPNDTGKGRMEKPRYYDPSDMGRRAKHKKHYRNRPTDATFNDRDPVNRGASAKRNYNPGDPRKNLNKLFPIDDGKTINDPILKELDHSDHAASPFHPTQTRHYFPVPDHKYLKTGTRARGRYVGTEDKWGDLIRGRRMDTAETIVYDPTIASSKRGLSEEGGNEGLDPEELGGRVDVQPRVQLVGNSADRDEDLTWRPLPLDTQQLHRSSENPFKDNDPDGDFH